VLYIRDQRIRGDHVRTLGEACPNVVGVKYAVRDPARFGAVARDAGAERFTWLAGLAELSAPGYFALGATGFTSGLVNVAPKLSLEMLDALRAGDQPTVMKVWEHIDRSRSCGPRTPSADNVSVVKEALARLGLCRRDVRPPSRLLPATVAAEVEAVLHVWGLL